MPQMRSESSQILSQMRRSRQAYHKATLRKLKAKTGMWHLKTQMSHSGFAFGYFNKQEAELRRLGIILENPPAGFALDQCHD